MYLLKFEILLIHHKKLQSESFTAGRNMTTPISILQRERGGSYGQTVAVTETAASLKTMAAAVWMLQCGQF